MTPPARRPGGRALRRALLALLAVLVATLLPGAAAPAAASPLPDLPIPGLPDCQGEPVPQSPDRGFNGYVTPIPVDPPPLGADPFADGATVTVYETTGLAGYRWHTYVDSCVPGPGQATNQALTSSANALMAVPVLCLGVVASLADVVYNQRWLTVLDEPVGAVSQALLAGFTEPFLPVIVLGVALVLLVSIRRARLSAAIGTVVLVLVAATLAAFAASYPTRVSEATDDITAGAITSINGALAGSRDASPDVATVSPLVEAMLYDRWVAGTLGDTTSPTARTYGPQLYQASTLTWAETELVRSDPDGAGAELLADKQEQWESAAAAVQRTDPDAYEYLTGERSIDRVGHAIVALALIAILPFLVVSLVLVALSYLIIRVIIMFLPLVALIALLVRGTLSGLASLAAAAVVNSVVFAVGAAVAAYLFGVFLSPDTGIPALLGLLLAFLVSIAMWILLSPYRRLTRLVRSRDAVKAGTAEAERLGGGVRGFVTGAGKVALGVFAGRKAVEAARGDDEDDEKGDEEKPGSSGASRPENSTNDGQPGVTSPGQAGGPVDGPGDAGAGDGTGAGAGGGPGLGPGVLPGVVIGAGSGVVMGDGRDGRPAVGDADDDPVVLRVVRMRRDEGLAGGTGDRWSPPSSLAVPVSRTDGPPSALLGSRLTTGDGAGAATATRPEALQLQGFDPVVVDGDEVLVVYTLDGTTVDKGSNGSRDGDEDIVDAEMVDGDDGARR